MENSKGLLAVSIVALAVAALAVGLAFRSSSSVTVTTGSPSLTASTPAGVPESSDSLIGANADETTNLISLSLSDDLAVSDDVSIGGDTTFTGTSTFSGNVSGSVAFRPTVSMTTATTTPCAIQNTLGSDRTLAAIGGVWTAYTGAGTVGLTVGTSTSRYVTSTSPLINNLAFANSASQSVIATTSTLQSAYAIWKSGEWLVWKTSTSTNAGTCSAIAF